MRVDFRQPLSTDPELLEIARNKNYFLIKMGHIEFTGGAVLYENGHDAVELAVKQNSAHVALHFVAKMGNLCIQDCLPGFYAMTACASEALKWKKAARKFQSIYRRHKVFRRYRHYFKKNLPLWVRFKSVWLPAVKADWNRPQAVSWSAIKRQFDIIATREDDEITDLIDSVAAMAVEETATDSTSSEIQSRQITAQPDTLQQAPVTSIELSQAIWFVSKHDNVKKYLTLIDNSCNRLAKLPAVQEFAESFMVLSEEDVLIDPRGNCPLKIYVSSGAEISDVNKVDFRRFADKIYPDIQKKCRLA
eukprot:gene38530-47578_t